MRARRLNDMGVKMCVCVPPMRREGIERDAVRHSAVSLFHRQCSIPCTMYWNGLKNECFALFVFHLFIQHNLEKHFKIVLAL